MLCRGCAKPQRIPETVEHGRQFKLGTSGERKNQIVKSVRFWLGPVVANTAPILLVLLLAAQIGRIVPTLDSQLILLALVAVLGGLSLFTVEYRFPGILILILATGIFLAGRDFVKVFERAGIGQISPAELVIVLSGLVIVVKAQQHTPLRLPRIPGRLPLVALGFTWVIAFLQGFSYSIVESLRFSIVVVYAMFLLLVPAVVTSRDRLNVAIRVTMIAAAISVIQPFLGYGFDGVHWQWGILLFFLLIPVIRWQRYWPARGLLVIATSLAILTSQVRSVWVALAGAFLFFFVLAAQRIWIRKRLRSILIVVGGAGVLMAFGIAIAYESLGAGIVKEVETFNPAYYLDFSLEASTGSVANARTRLGMWSIVLQESIGHPLVGVGLGTPFYYEGMDEARMFGEAYGWARPGYNAPHSSYMHILLRMGFPALIAYLLFWAQFLLGAVRSIRKMDDVWLRNCALALALSVSYVLAVGLTAPVLENPYTGCVLWLLAGTLVATVSLQYRDASKGVQGQPVVSLSEVSSQVRSLATVAGHKTE